MPRADEEEEKDIDITEQEPETYQRLKRWEEQWRESMKADQAAYKGKSK